MPDKKDNRLTPYSNVKEQWHLSRGINMSHIFTTVAVIFGGLIYVDGIAHEVQLQRAELEFVQEKQEIQNIHIQAATKKIESKLERIDGKLDDINRSIIKLSLGEK